MNSYLQLPIIKINNDLSCFRERSSKYQRYILVFSISMTTKSTRNINLSTFSKTSSTTPWEYLIDLSATYNVFLVGWTSRFQNIFINDKGIKLILAPKSNKAFPTDNVHIVTWIVKLRRSLYFDDKDFWIIALHPTSNFMVSSFTNLLLFVSISSINLTNVGIFSKASKKEY